MASSNDFKLTCAAITSMTYLDNSFVITKGEASAPPPTFKKDGSAWTVTIIADRKGSSPVAQSFVAQTGGSFHQYTNAGGDKSPDSLNFYFGVTAEFLIAGVAKPVPVLIYLGQGHNPLGNNWWIGGNTLTNGSDPYLHVVEGGQILATFKISGSGNSSMTLTQV